MKRALSSKALRYLISSGSIDCCKISMAKGLILTSLHEEVC